MGSRGPLPTSWSSETARGRNTFFATAPAAPPESDVPPPVWLDDDARDFWMITAPPLVQSGRLRASMAAAFAILSQLAVECERLSGEVADEGTVVDSPRGTKANPKVRLLRDARRDFLGYCKAFGLEPSSNSRLPASEPGEAEPDPLDEYIKARRG